MPDAERLYSQAVLKFGEERAGELRPDIEQVAAELLTLYKHSLDFDDAP